MSWHDSQRSDGAAADSFRQLPRMYEWEKWKPPAGSVCSTDTTAPITMPSSSSLRRSMLCRLYRRTWPVEKILSGPPRRAPPRLA
jgi:hypothetical protein